MEYKNDKFHTLKKVKTFIKKKIRVKNKHIRRLKAFLNFIKTL